MMTLPLVPHSLSPDISIRRTAVRRALPFWLGYAFVLFFTLAPLLLLGKGISLPLLDWLDGDITGKVLLGRNLMGVRDYFSPQVPQMMRGAAMWSNAPSTLLYAWLTPFSAYVAECFLAVSAAYWGMALFLRRVLTLVTGSPSGKDAYANILHKKGWNRRHAQSSDAQRNTPDKSLRVHSADVDNTHTDRARPNGEHPSSALVNSTSAAATPFAPLLPSAHLCAAVAVLFACLPFYTVHDLTTMGIPLVLWAFLVLWAAGQNLTPRRASPALVGAAYGAVLLFGACSTLAFSGYFILGFLALFLLVQAMRRRFAGVRYLALAFALLCALYGAANLGLVQSIFGLGDSDFVSHRTIYAPGTLAAGEVFSEFKTMLLHGQYHAGSKHLAALACAALILGAAVPLWKRLTKAQRRLWLFCASLLGGGVLIAAFYAFCGTAAYVRFVALLGPAIASFQFDRLYFLYPTLWYTLLAGAVLLVVHAGPQGAFRLPRILPRATAVLVLAACFAFVLRGNYLTGNWQAVLTGVQPANAVTWRQFFAEDLFDDIRAALSAEGGTALHASGSNSGAYDAGSKTSTAALGNSADSTVSDPRGASAEPAFGFTSSTDADTAAPVVVSLGISPAIALYNGFSTLDGYSNNYALSYHEQFGRVLRDEINKDAALAAYFYDWGNRCYLFTPQLGADFSYRRDAPDAPRNPLTDLAFDWQTLREMGGTHVLSISPIAGCAQYGLTDCGKFAGEAYDLYVYAL